ncbi:MAG: low-specificity L-threonine aldolase [Phycisphaerales bacterium]|nr:MAG: low-specificity L-threonine aldolase [Phycisphaerales bacterium]
MKVVDLRSDTVTLPTQAMRDAIYQAELGDDVFGDDPTVNRLEQMAAERMGKEAALLVASGTMGNLVSILTHCRRGEEAILGDLSHTFLHEAGGISALGGIHPHTVKNRPDGTLRLEDIEAAIRGDNVHYPRTRLICLENTQNHCGGAPLTPKYTRAVAALAKRHSLSVHLDGARIFNAAVALGLGVKELTDGADSVSFCLSKGLSAPVGSVVCGPKEFIAEARRTRKVVGGGMRQAGIIAAAGITALDEMTDRLRVDHANARRLAEGIAQIDGLAVDLQRVQTNIVYFDLQSDRQSADDLVTELAKNGIKLLHLGAGSLRAVTHYGIEQEDIDRALQALEKGVSTRAGWAGSRHKFRKVKKTRKC